MYGFLKYTYKLINKSNLQNKNIFTSFRMLIKNLLAFKIYAVIFAVHLLM